MRHFPPAHRRSTALNVHEYAWVEKTYRMSPDSYALWKESDGAELAEALSFRPSTVVNVTETDYGTGDVVITEHRRSAA